MITYTVPKMEAMIRAALNESSQAIISSADILRVLNDAQKEVAIKALCIEKYLYATARDGEKIIPVDCLKVLSVHGDAVILFFDVTVGLGMGGPAALGNPGVPVILGTATVVTETPITELRTLTVPAVPTIVASTVVA